MLKHSLLLKTWGHNLKFKKVLISLRVFKCNKEFDFNERIKINNIKIGIKTETRC